MATVTASSRVARLGVSLTAAVAGVFAGVFTGVFAGAGAGGLVVAGVLALVAAGVLPGAGVAASAAPVCAKTDRTSEEANMATRRAADVI
ncbi:hypothetical protein GCM10010168_65310 [Actinoplanes ianthinogenes]|uniref:Uncharacterized protein n=1 Tax=Actinoplanes ianthinogenes TaxID=122358 RepID=A0ABN6C9I9_9ACTN|nr:hypothetical protein Aiant_27480 [Actinoplanes ianthinogenes]GGR37741.1 hypothetical protein GCM10010168_65310 [Actinoplanes ianthinogenes]